MSINVQLLRVFTVAAWRRVQLVIRHRQTDWPLQAKLWPPRSSDLTSLDLITSLRVIFSLCSWCNSTEVLASHCPSKCTKIWAKRSCNMHIYPLAKKHRVHLLNSLQDVYFGIGMLCLTSLTIKIENYVNKFLQCTIHKIGKCAGYKILNSDNVTGFDKSRKHGAFSGNCRRFISVLTIYIVVTRTLVTIHF